MGAPKSVLFYKPYGVLSQFTPEAGHKSLAEFNLPKGVYPAGRLDHDTEGLLILSEDGSLIHRLVNPQVGHTRVYLAQVERIPSAEALARLEKGVKLSDGWTKPCRVRLLMKEPTLPPRDPPIRYRKTVPTAWLELTLTEGRNRQVRRMTAAIGHPTLRLIRSRLGRFGLGTLWPGHWRWLDREELKDPFKFEAPRPGWKSKHKPSPPKRKPRP